MMNPSPQKSIKEKMVKAGEKNLVFSGSLVEEQDHRKP